jgi:hypothetical protein
MAGFGARQFQPSGSLCLESTHNLPAKQCNSLVKLDAMCFFFVEFALSFQLTKTFLFTQMLILVLFYMFMFLF